TGAVCSSASLAHKRLIEHASQFWRGRRDAVFLFRTSHLEMSTFVTKRTIRSHLPLSVIGVNVCKTIFAVKTTNNDSRRMQARNIESKHQQVEQARQEESQALAHNLYSICGQ